jgi:hypothetical protein
VGGRSRFKIPIDVVLDDEVAFQNTPDQVVVLSEEFLESSILFVKTLFNPWLVRSEFGNHGGNEIYVAHSIAA